ncbi:GHKL domain protein [Leptospira ryugenii]|uniref:Chemotaxis protein CheA n=1 Tax=Leptospira ryugenii TaxID=1917863 RepID=A0A2P2DWN1_9LEPT|nr:chemotaxis protein CheA [Leptospira ryugenii]GBF48980.1 GHKL domain protein [Leptospira ryugenii]
MDLSEVIDAYILESQDLLESMEEILLRLEQETPSEEDLNALFRAVHTIKGTSGMFGFSETVKFTHTLENLLDELRSHKIDLNQALVSILIRCKDQLLEFVLEEPKHNLTNAQLQNAELLLNEIRKDNGEKPSLLNETQSIAHALPKKNNADGTQNYLISLRPHQNVFQLGLDPYSFLNYLKKLGTILYLKTIHSSIPEENSYNPELCYLGFEIRFDSKEPIEKIREVFEFLEADAFLHILPPHSDLQELVDLSSQLPEEEIYLGNIWKEMGTISDNQLVRFLGILKHGSSEVETQLPSLEPTNKEIPIDQNKANHTLRVDANRIDALIHRVGELVVAQANLNQNLLGKADPILQESLFHVGRLLTEVREISLKLRMIQIGEVLQKYQRIVRDLGKELNKSIHLSIEGKETELDRNILDKLGDPLVHMIRNACDHGLETSEERLRTGKPATGELKIRAYHDTGMIVIEISDDGRGIDPEIIWKKAIEKGIVDGPIPEAKEDVYSLLFHPGFSTAATITNVSGRGVGLDVVHKNIEALRGSITIHSTKGKGTSFQLRLPLTLAIIDGFLVGVGKSHYVIPMDSVLECLEFSEEHSEVKNQFFPLRGALIPYIKMKDAYDIQDNVSQRRKNIVIVQTGEKKAGLVVDRLFGEFQTVIKPMGSVFQHVKGVSGSSILADGSVALIVDLPSLFERTMYLERNKN